MIIFSPGWPQRQQNGHFTYTNFNIIGQIPLDLGGGGQTFTKECAGTVKKKIPPAGSCDFTPLNRGASLRPKWE